MSSAAATRTLPKSAELAALEVHAASAARLLKLMASEPRLMLLCRLGQGECSVGELAAHVSLSQTAASQHLAKLRAEGIVATRREGQTIHYRLIDPAAASIIETLCKVFQDGGRQPVRPSARRG